MTAADAGVPSPCINVCRMNGTTGWCEGCHRTLDEIRFWSVLDDSDKHAVWALLPARREQMPTPLAEAHAGASVASTGA